MSVRINNLKTEFNAALQMIKDLEVNREEIQFRKERINNFPDANNKTCLQLQRLEAKDTHAALVNLIASLSKVKLTDLEDILDLPK